MNDVASISTPTSSRKSIRIVQLRLFECLLRQFHPSPLTSMLQINAIFKFMPAPKAVKAFKYSSATINCTLLNRCLIKFRPIYLTFSLGISFYYILFESSHDEPHHSDSNLSAFYSDDSTYCFGPTCRRRSCVISIIHKTATPLTQISTILSQPVFKLYYHLHLNLMF